MLVKSIENDKASSEESIEESKEEDNKEESINIDDNEENEEFIEEDINFKLNNKITDKTIVEELTKQYDALYIATGSSVPKFMKIPGESLNGVYSSKDFLRLFNLESDNVDFVNNVKDKNVAVIGGGNSAMDATRCAIRMGAKNVTIIYRRSLEELPARKIELEEAQAEGVKLCLLTNPVEILESKNNGNHVGSIKCIKMELGEPDESGRRRPVEIKDSEYEMGMDCVVMAISSSCESSVYDGLLDNKWGYILVDDNQKTNIDNIFAGGDVVTGPNTVVHAIKAGIDAAKSIDELLNKNV